MTTEPSVDPGGVASAGWQDRAGEELRRWSAGTLVALLWSAAALIGWRRLADSIDVPLRPTWLLSAGGLVVMAAVGIRLLRPRRPQQPQSAQPDWLLTLLVTAAVLAFGAAVSLQGTATWGLVALWAMLLLEEAWAWWGVIGRTPRGGRVADPRWPSNVSEQRRGRPAPAIVTDGPPGEDVVQHLVRSQAADGSEELRGWLRAPFATGQRTTLVHLAFCPQFVRTPELTVEQIDGPEIVRINKALFSFGARLDLKLAVAAEGACSVLLQVSARCRPSAPAASAGQEMP